MTTDPNVHGDTPTTPGDATEPPETVGATRTPPMMACGHAANGTQRIDGVDVPCCVICAGTGVGEKARTVVAAPPDLTGRRARCTYFDESIGKCKPTRHTRFTNPTNSERASDPGLPFFEYMGPGSEHATQTCKCRYHAVAHLNPNPLTGRPGITNHKFEPIGPAEFDRFYCGCWGWD